MFGRKESDKDDIIQDLQVRYDQIVAERQSLYSLVDKLTGYCEGLEKRIDTQRVGIEALEDRVTSLECRLEFCESLDNRIDGIESRIQDCETENERILNSLTNGIVTQVMRMESD